MRRTSLKELYCLNARLGLDRFVRGINYWRCIEYPWIIENLHICRNERILDIGSSSCSLLALQLASKRKYVVCVTDIDDVVQKHVALAKKLMLEDQITTGRFVVKKSDATSLAFQDETFDRITAVSILEHIPDNGDKKAVLEFWRVLKPGGLVLITVPYGTEYRETFVMKDIYQRTYKGEPLFYQRHYDGTALMDRVIGPSGLKLRKIEYFGETSIRVEKLWDSVPSAIKVVFGWMMPLVSTLFIHQLAENFLEKAMACFLVLEKKT